MNVLVTGGNGFVGSHVVDALAARGLPVTLLLRPGSDRRWINAQQAAPNVREGSLDEPGSLRAALEGITHVINCAGLVRALRTDDFFRVNELGTRNLVSAVNERRSEIQRLVHLSSLAAAGPAQPGRVRRESDPPAPVSVYGESKLAGEREVTRGCRCEHVVLRPPGVYGPRDGEFLSLFQAVQNHLLPLFGGGRQELSLVYAPDLAEAVVRCVNHPGVAGKVYFVNAPEVTTAGGLAREIAAQMGGRTFPLRLPTAALWPVCAGQELVSRLTGRPNVVSLQKYAELRAPAWTCSAERLAADLGWECPTGLAAGVAATLAWYRQEGWL